MDSISSIQVIDAKKANYIQLLFSLFCTKKPVASEIINLIADKPFVLHGEDISNELKYEGGYIRPILKKMVKYGILKIKQGSGKQHRAAYYAVDEFKIAQLETTYNIFKPKQL